MYNYNDFLCNRPRDVLEAIPDSNEQVEALEHRHSDKHQRRAKRKRSIHSVKGDVHPRRKHRRGKVPRHGGEYALTPLNMMIQTLPGEVTQHGLDHRTVPSYCFEYRKYSISVMEVRCTPISS